MLHVPIFHVNADDPEAVVHTAQLAIAFRQRFQTDVLIDLCCYRRQGHNEADDPIFTQPFMYHEIAAHPTVVQVYDRQLTERGAIAPTEVEQMRQAVRLELEAARNVAREHRPRQRFSTLGGLWKGRTRAGDDWGARTAVGLEVLREVGAKATQVPPEFSLHPKLDRLLAGRPRAQAQHEGSQRRDVHVH